MGTETQRYPGAGAAMMLGFIVGTGTAGVAGRSAASAQTRVRELTKQEDALLARQFSDPTAQRVRDARVQMLRFEQSSPAYLAQRNGRAAIAGALLAVGSLIAPPVYVATRS